MYDRFILNYENIILIFHWSRGNQLASIPLILICYDSPCTSPLAPSPGQVKLDLDKWKLWKNLFELLNKFCWSPINTFPCTMTLYHCWCHGKQICIKVPWHWSVKKARHPKGKGQLSLIFLDLTKTILAYYSLSWHPNSLCLKFFSPTYLKAKFRKKKEK